MKLNSTNPEIRWAKPAISDLLAVRKLRNSAEANLLKTLVKAASDAYSLQSQFDQILRISINGVFAVSI
jgi:hypothetical protein